MSIKIFKDIFRFNTIDNNKHLNALDDGYEESIDFHFSLIAKGVKGIIHALQNNDIPEIRERACDALFAIYSIFYVLKYPYEDEVCEEAEYFTSTGYYSICTWPVMRKIVRSNSNETALAWLLCPKGTYRKYIEELEEKLHDVEEGCKKYSDYDIVVACNKLVDTILYVQAKLNIDSDADLSLYVESKFTKFCTSEEDALATIDKWNLIGVGADFTVIEDVVKLYVVKITFLPEGFKEVGKYKVGTVVNSVNYSPVFFG